MATYTGNLNLKKPDQSDKIRIADFNGNSDAIDAAIGGSFGVGSNPSIDDAVNSMGEGLAIISNGNTHAAITSGKYVYVRGHGTLAEGLYVATASIAQNGTLSLNNVSAVSGGGLNALNSKFGKELWNDTAFTTGSVTIPELSNYKLFMLVFDDTIQLLATLVGNLLWGGCNIGAYASDGIGSYGCRYGVSGNQITINATNRGYTNGTTSNYSGNTTGLIKVYGIV